MSAFSIHIGSLGRSDNAFDHDFVHLAGAFAVRIESGVTLNCPALDAMSQRSTTLGSPLMHDRQVTSQVTVDLSVNVTAAVQTLIAAIGLNPPHRVIKKLEQIVDAE